MTRTGKSGFALIEVLIAVVIIGVALLALLQVRNQSIHQFLTIGDQHTASWLAELKMNELVSQDLPDPQDEETWEDFDSGNFAYLDKRANELNAAYNRDWVWRDEFAKFEFEWKKEVIFIGREFIGNQWDLEGWEPAVDEYGEAIDQEDPHENPAVRVVRVTLTVYLPEDSSRPAAEGTSTSERKVQMVNGRPAIQLVTYVDPSVLFAAEDDEAAETTTPAPPAPAPAPGTGG
ncbi:MAG: prepilin-type N-terminal cleavage/methylation domain-containing protein [Planctomycetes bacterium]|nr:prepilin-type N-terminal cleavage/methylation domain-containing protein [Planctomycetota bacterium]